MFNVGASKPGVDPPRSMTVMCEHGESYLVINSPQSMVM